MPPHSKDLIDRTRVNTSIASELAYWKTTLGVSRAELEHIVRKVGVMASDVLCHLEERQRLEAVADRELKARHHESLRRER